MDQAARQHRRRAIRGQSVPPKTSDRTPPDRRHTRPGPGCAAPGVRPAIPRCPTAVRAAGPAAQAAFPLKGVQTAGANHPSSSRTATRQATPTTDTPAPRPGRSAPVLPACNRNRSRARPAPSNPPRLLRSGRLMACPAIRRPVHLVNICAALPGRRLHTEHMADSRAWSPAGTEPMSPIDGRGPPDADECGLGPVTAQCDQAGHARPPHCA